MSKLFSSSLIQYIFQECYFHLHNCIDFFSVVNLVEGIDVPVIEAKIAYYQKENAEQIMNAQARKVCQMMNA